MSGGVVRHAGPGGTGGFSSRHVVVEIDDEEHGKIFNVYVHLNSIHRSVTTGATVKQGQQIATVGDDHATYPHLHMEFRKGTPKEIGSVHPLGFLPYISDTVNFSAPVADRFNRWNTRMAARLAFGAPSKLEGDLQRVEVDLLKGPDVLETRAVDFEDKTTIHEGNSDELSLLGGIGVEGYQKSDMILHGQTDLTDIPEECSSVRARAGRR
jgi:hypothetical protein